MRRVLPAAVLAALFAVAGCGGGMAKVKGKLVENGEPKAFAPFSASVQFAKIGDDGKPDETKMYSAIVNADGTFELVASGGQLPAGMYQVVIEMPVKPGQRQPFAAHVSPIRRDLKSGQNDLTIDLAKPEGCPRGFRGPKMPRAARIGRPATLSGIA